jgi:hypothetical protein
MGQSFDIPAIASNLIVILQTRTDAEELTKIETCSEMP